MTTMTFYTKNLKNEQVTVKVTHDNEVCCQCLLQKLTVRMSQHLMNGSFQPCVEVWWPCAKGGYGMMGTTHEYDCDLSNMTDRKHNCIYGLEVVMTTEQKPCL